MNKHEEGLDRRVSEGPPRVCMCLTCGGWRAGEPQGVHQDEPHAGTRGDAGGGAAGRAAFFMLDPRDVHLPSLLESAQGVVSVCDGNGPTTHPSPPALGGHSIHTFSTLSPFSTPTQAMRDMRAHEVDVLTLGQYLRPTEHHLSVVEYVTPDMFDFYRVKGEV